MAKPTKKSTKTSNTSIIPFEMPVKNITYDKPDLPDLTCKSHTTRIANAYNNCTYLDKGIIWIESSRISDILRTNKANANYIIANDISSKSKKTFGDKTYVAGYEIRKILDKFIQEEGASKKKAYLIYSEGLYLAIRDSQCAEKMRINYNLISSQNRKSLKKARLKKYKIKYDELTGLKLISKASEFSHIRSYALFKEIGDDIENGLIVNKDTHAIITKHGINDETELLNLCLERNWNTSWFNSFKTFLSLI